MRFLFVCADNLCRSPFAAGLTNRLVRTVDADFRADSAGLAPEFVDRPAPTLAIAIAADFGVSLVDHRSHILRSSDFALYDFLVALDRDDLRAIADLRALSARNGCPVTGELRLFSSLTGLDDHPDIASTRHDDRKKMTAAFERIARGAIRLTASAHARQGHAGTHAGVRGK